MLGVASAAVIVAASSGIVGFTTESVRAQTTTRVAHNSDFERGYADLVARVQPAVVNVSVDKTEKVAQGSQTPFNDNPEMRRFFERFFGQPMPQQQQPREFREHGEGSGFIINKDGYIITNAHVAGDASKIEVVFQDGKTLPAKLVGIDEKTDLAVIKIDAGRPLPYVEWGDSGKVRVGDKILAVGNPFGLGGTVTSGIVSATGRELGAGPYDDFLQVDAAINRGNSGGPTFNLDGQVVGVNSIIYSPSGGNVGIGFAIASNLARQITTNLIEHGSVTRGWLGVGIQQVTPDLAQSMSLSEPQGAIVTSVEPNSPAAHAGLQTGDVIVSFNGAKIEKVRELTRAVADVDPGRTAPLEIKRNGKDETVSVDVGKMPSQKQVAANQPEQADQPRLGLSLATLTPDAKRQLSLPLETKGVLVEGVQPGSPAEDKGIQAGDVILRVGNEQVNSADQVIKLVRTARERGDKSVLLLVQREGAQLFAAIPFAVS